MFKGSKMKSQNAVAQKESTATLDEYIKLKVAIGSQHGMSEDVVKGAINDFRESLRANVESPSSWAFSTMAACHHGSTLFNVESEALLQIANGLRSVEVLMNSSPNSEQ